MRPSRRRTATPRVNWNRAIDAALTSSASTTSSSWLRSAAGMIEPKTQPVATGVNMPSRLPPSPSRKTLSQSRRRVPRRAKRSRPQGVSGPGGNGR